MCPADIIGDRPLYLRGNSKFRKKPACPRFQPSPRKARNQVQLVHWKLRLLIEGTCCQTHTIDVRVALETATRQSVQRSCFHLPRQRLRQKSGTRNPLFSSEKLPADTRAACENREVRGDIVLVIPVARELAPASVCFNATVAVGASVGVSGARKSSRKSSRIHPAADTEGPLRSQNTFISACASSRTLAFMECLARS